VLPLGQRILQQVFGDAVEKGAGQLGSAAQVAAPYDAVPGMAVLQARPPLGGGNAADDFDLRPLQLVERRLQAFGDLRQLARQQLRHRRRVAGLCRRVAKGLQRLQQILDVVRDAGAGFIHRLQVAHTLQFVGLELDEVELGGQAQQPIDVPAHRRGGYVAEIDG